MSNDQNTKHCEKCGDPLEYREDGDLCRRCNRLYIRLKLTPLGEAFKKATQEVAQNENSPARPLSRMEKAVDFLIGEFLDEAEWDQHDKHPPSLIPLAIVKDVPNSIAFFLILTEPYYYLPNRKRLLELVEKAIPKEEAKP